MLQSGTLQNDQVTKQYVTQHRHYDKSRNSTLQNSLLKYFQKQCNSQKSIKPLDTKEKSSNPWIAWAGGALFIVTNHIQR